MEESLTVVESMCPLCQDNGETRLLPHKIPYFRTILVSSFSCPHCGHRNNEVQPISEIQPQGETITLKATVVSDLDRQVVKSEHASVRIPELDFDIPATTQRGISSTVQGMVSQAANALKSTQPERYQVDAEVARQVGEFIEKLEALVEAPANSDSTKPLATPFTFVLDDPSGNSFIENPLAPQKDPQLQIQKYARTKEQLHAMGFYEEQGEKIPQKLGADLPEERQSHSVWDLSQAASDNVEEAQAHSAVFKFPCSHCGKEGNQNMCEIDVPGFRKCWVMAFVCDFCGAKSNEVKPAGRFGDKGRRWTLKVETEADLNRDILKSDSASVEIPSLELVLDYGTLGGVFTTIEGLLLKIAEEVDTKMPFHGDSQLEERRQRILHIVSELKEMAAGKRFPFDFILDDMADLSHIGRRDDELLFLTNKKSAQTERGADFQLRNETYERSFEQNDELGLNDMKVENY